MYKSFHREIIHGKCIDISSEGKGVVKEKGKIIFVSGLFLYEEADIEILYSRAGVYFGRVSKLYKSSPYRVQPKCLVCTACGGCTYQQIAYSEQLKYKQNRVYNSLKRLGDIDTKVNETIGMDNPYNYRNKIQIPLGYDNKNHIISGFYRERSHEIIPINECAIEDKRASKIIKTIKELMPSFKMYPYDEDRRTGLLRHILIRTSYYKEEIMVVLVSSKQTWAGRSNFVKELVLRCPEITTIVSNTNSRDTNVILGEKEEVLYGKGYIEDSLCGLVFQISSKSFYQTNPVQTEKLYQIAIQNGNFTKDDIVLDAYSGIGTIGLIVSKNVNKVYSVEIVKEATKDAINNAKRNNINNVEFFNDDAGDFLVKSKSINRKIDVVIMDPPRNGSDNKFLSCLLEYSPRKIIYISCEPSTLARDLKQLKSKYMVSSVQPVDMFPMTPHVETVALLVHKDSKK
ncbi:MAG: 23S rRNA (uracil(1939)-C(5))-methyltransferase RlmD [Bacilli bacterium]